MSRAKNNINNLCKKCERKCKQAKNVIVLGCPNFSKKPVQLEIKFSYYKKRVEK